MRKSTQKGVAIGSALAAVPVIVVGAELALHPPCGLKDECDQTAELIDYPSVKYKLLQESFTLYTGHSENTLFNTTKVTIGSAALQKLVSYYETTFSRPEKHTLAISPTPGSRPTDVSFTAQPREVTDHKFIVVDNDNAMPYDLSNAGLTFTGGLIPPYESITVAKGEDARRLSALDVLAVEACQAVVEVAPTHNPVITQLGQETLCNSMGQAITMARHGESYTQYEHEIDSGDQDGNVTFEGSAYNIDLAVVSPDIYGTMSRTFGTA